MLGGKLKWVDYDEVKGEGSKGAYHFCNATFSDGLESIELPLDLALIPTAQQLKRGQDINITTSIKKSGKYDFSVTVKKISVN